MDRFILSRLEEVGLRPAPTADRNTWFRRVTFDLTGLPPTRHEIEDFLADDTSTAAEAVVDRLLADTAFGEYWAQHWLDLVRFAETKGHEQDFDIPNAWRYRDYVIRAFNANVPYDDFVREHIAGDLMNQPRIDGATQTNESIQGTAFWHLGEATHSPVDIRGDEADRVANALDVFGKTFLGMTIACARCHDHKFDAISTEDYYALCGFIQSSSYQLANVADPAGQEKVAFQLKALNAAASCALFAAYCEAAGPRLKQLALDLAEAAGGSQSFENTKNCNRLSRLSSELQRARDDAQHPLHAFVVAAEVLSNQSISSSLEWRTTFEQRLAASKQASDRSIVLHFPASPSTTNRQAWLRSGLVFSDGPTHAGCLLLRADKVHPLARIAVEPSAASWSISTKLTGVLRTATFNVENKPLWYRYRGEAEVFADVDSHRTVAGPLHSVVKQLLKSPTAETWFRHDLRDYVGHRAHIEFVPQGEFELFEICFSSDQPSDAEHVNARMRRMLATDNSPSNVLAAAQAAVAAFEEALRHETECLHGRSELAADDARLVNWLLEHDDLLLPAESSAAAAYAAEAFRYAERHGQLEAELPEPVWAMALLDGSGVDVRVHIRGSHRLLAKQVTPRRFLTALDGEMTITNGSGRDQLAERLVDPNNPLTARVFVNRVWHHLFGQGLVATVDNFGALGDPPANLELLDFLTAEFVDDGWNVKRLIRRIALSSTYATSSTPDSSAATIDPANRLFHAARVRRIPAEAIRDAILAVSGELNRQPYGPSVQVHRKDPVPSDNGIGANGPLNGDGRRSIYLEVRRNALDHFLAAFDKPSPFTTVGSRYVSNSAAQPLALSNDPLVHMAAEKWADSLVHRFTADKDAIRDAFLSAFGRIERADEADCLSAYIDAAMRADHSQATRRQAWREICLTLFNVKEFVFIR